MLIPFTVENFRSINEEVVFSIFPSRVEKHSNHIIRHPKQDGLRIALLYGANGSGKSNLIKAIDFARRLIVNGTPPKQSIPVEPFRLEKNRNQPSRFEFEFTIGEELYAYGFVVDRQRVHEEWLYLVNHEEDSLLFERTTNHDGTLDASFGSIDEEKQFLAFVARATRPNQLLLTKLIDDNVKSFDLVYHWFSKVLTIIFPDTQATSILLRVWQDETWNKSLGGFLREMNTGIEQVCAKPIEIESIDLPSPDSVLREADNWIKTYQIDDDDELWLVIDVDRWGAEKLSQISQQYIQKKISLAVSNPTIELWFLLHWVDISNYPNDVQKELLENGRVSSSRKRLEQEIIDVVGSFNKSNLNANDYIPHVENAIHHADLLGVSPTDRWPQTLGTQVHLLMKSILGLKKGNKSDKSDRESVFSGGRTRSG